MYRFYCPDADFSKPSIVISDAHEIHHIKDVLRMKNGSKLQVFNAKSQQAEVVIEEIKDAAIRVRVEEITESQEGGARIVLACAPPKKGKFEFIIEKCTELGVDEIIPLKTKRSEVVFTEGKMAGKLGRFESVAVNAAKQSKRTKVPRICPMTPLIEVLKALDPKALKIIPSLNGQTVHIVEVLNNFRNPVSGPPTNNCECPSSGPKTFGGDSINSFRGDSVVVFIGPEGDFTPDELELAVKHGCVPVSLGDTVLKVETAAIAAVALVKFLCRN